MISIRLTSLLFSFLMSSALLAADPQWIWGTRDANVSASADTIYFRKTIELAKPKAGHLEITCDNHYLLYFNGRRLGTGSNWNERHHYDVTSLLREGRNVIAVAGRNDGTSPAGLVVRVHMRASEGESWHSTDASWKFTGRAPDGSWPSVDFDASAWKPAFALGEYGKAGPWGTSGAKTAAVSRPVRAPRGKRAAQDDGPFELLDGDRVVLLGSTYVERMQAYGFLETQLTLAYPNRSLTFRNLGWSGDDVTGIARAVFGDQAAGFQRLEKDLLDAEPTVILVCYGGNEAHLGQRGLAQFKEDLEVLLEVLEETGSRVALLSPMSYENPGPPLPNPKDYNQRLRAYCDVLRSAARDRGHHYADLYSRLDQMEDVSAQPAIRNTLTDNGVHLNEYGYWRTARGAARKLGAPAVDWKVDLNVGDKSYDATGTMLSELSVEPTKVVFSARDLHLPFPTPPESSPRGAKLVAPHALVRIRGLAEGDYGLRIDDQPTVMADEEQWAAGVRVNLANYLPQVRQLREVIHDKNALYFYRYRPQNETYLFLFRKHEQGNNAVEIPQFDPLIAEKEKLIAKLRVPATHTYRLVRLKKDKSTDD